MYHILTTPVKSVSLNTERSIYSSFLMWHIFTVCKHSPAAAIIFQSNHILMTWLLLFQEYLDQKWLQDYVKSIHEKIVLGDISRWRAWGKYFSASNNILFSWQCFADPLQLPAKSHSLSCLWLASILKQNITKEIE